MTRIHAGITSVHIFYGYLIPIGGCIDRNFPRMTSGDTVPADKSLRKLKSRTVEVPFDL